MATNQPNGLATPENPKKHETNIRLDSGQGSATPLTVTSVLRQSPIDRHFETLEALILGAIQLRPGTYRFETRLETPSLLRESVGSIRCQLAGGRTAPKKSILITKRTVLGHCSLNGFTVLLIFGPELHRAADIVNPAEISLSQ